MAPRQDQMRWRVFRGPGTAEQVENKLKCRVCGFPGISPYAIPGESRNPEGSVEIVTSNAGTYTWSSPIDPVSVITQSKVVYPNVNQACPDCGAERYLDGKRGSAHRAPNG